MPNLIRHLSFDSFLVQRLQIEQKPNKRFRIESGMTNVSAASRAHTEV
jgi:hypothetical protein